MKEWEPEHKKSRCSQREREREATCSRRHTHTWRPRGETHESSRVCRGTSSSSSKQQQQQQHQHRSPFSPSDRVIQLSARFVSNGKSSSSSNSRERERDREKGISSPTATVPEADWRRSPALPAYAALSARQVSSPETDLHSLSLSSHSRLPSRDYLFTID